MPSTTALPSLSLRVSRPPTTGRSAKKEYHKVLIKGLRDGYSLEQQGIDYTKQMVSMERCLNKHSKDTSNPLGTTAYGLFRSKLPLRFLMAARSSS